MRGVTPNYQHSYIFFLSILHCLISVFSINTLSSTETLTISSNRTIVSPGDVFELGFFKTTTSSRHWYLGIWYKSSSTRTYVWIANRDNPLSNAIGTFKISYANLVLLDQYDTPVWSTNLRKAVKSPLVAELLANGNFVLRDSKTNDPNGFLWESFDFPVDTLLPEMKIGRNLKTGHDRFLTSWRTPTDPSSGDFSFKLETQSLPEFYLIMKKEFRLYRTGPRNGIRFNGIPNMQNWSYVVSNFIENIKEVAYSFNVPNNKYTQSRFTLTSTGLLKMIITRVSTVPVRNTSPKCNCIKGFLPKNVNAWVLGDASEGCVRTSRLCCHGDGFFLMKNMKLPETSEVIVDKRIGSMDCKERCLKDCKCTGFANTDIRNGGSGCGIWNGELMDMRNYVVGGQDLYVRIAS